MNKEAQILKIKEFMNSNQTNILINQVNESLAIFYMNVVKYYADQHKIKLNINTDTEMLEAENDLFGAKAIQVFNITNTKKINRILEDHNKKIIFTDYKNFKKFNSKFLSINGYQFEKDILFFMQDEQNIYSNELLDYCKDNPILLFSEISKYLINNKFYVTTSPIEEKNHILEIRRSIFDLKKSNFSLKDLYFNIKKEAEYKKLNFLAY